MKPFQKGQGVVEYAGAIIVATTIVAAAIASNMSGLGTLFTTILTQASNMIVAAAEAIGQQ